MAVNALNIPEFNCQICSEMFRAPVIPYVFSCGHSFCQICIARVRQAMDRPEDLLVCGICRTRIPPNGIVQNYALTDAIPMAARVAEQLHEVDPIRMQLARAIQHKEVGEYEEAEEGLNAVLANAGASKITQVKARFELGLVQARRERWQQAITELSAVEGDPHLNPSDRVQARKEMGSIYTKLGNWAQAAVYLNRVIQDAEHARPIDRHQASLELGMLDPRRFNPVLFDLIRSEALGPADQLRARLYYAKSYLSIISIHLAKDPNQEISRETRSILINHLTIVRDNPETRPADRATARFLIVYLKYCSDEHRETEEGRNLIINGFQEVIADPHTGDRDRALSEYFLARFYESIQREDLAIPLLVSLVERNQLRIGEANLVVAATPNWKVEHSDWHKIRYILGSIYVRNRRYADATEVLAPACEKMNYHTWGDSGAACFQLGIAYLRLHRYEEARKILSALEDNSSSGHPGPKLSLRARELLKDIPSRCVIS